MQCSERIRRLFEHPEHAGRLPGSGPGRGAALVGCPGYGEVVRLEVQLDPSRQGIEEVRFLAAGCGFLIAVAEWTCRKIKGMPLAEAIRLQPDAIAGELQLPPAKVHCATLIAQAIAEAVSNAGEKKNAWNQSEKEDV